MRLGSTRCRRPSRVDGSRCSCPQRTVLEADASFRLVLSRRPEHECSRGSTRSFRLPPESANEIDCNNHRQKRQAVVNIRSVVSEPSKVEEAKSSSGTTNKSEEICKIELHIVTCQITTDKTTRAQVQTKIRRPCSNSFSTDWLIWFPC